LEAKYDLYNTPAFYGFVVFLVAFFMSLSSILLRLKFAHPREYAKFQEELRSWNSDKERAKKTGDKKLSAQLKKQEKRISQIQTKMMKGSLINMVVTLALFFAIWQVLSSYLLNKTVAYAPFFIPYITVESGPFYEMPFFFWYLICSFFSSTLLQRVFGMGVGMGLQPQTTK